MPLKFNYETCSGCKACQLVCALQNFKETNPSKSVLNVYGKFPVPGKYYVDVCNQCGECAKICPVEAINMSGNTYLIDYDTCIGCLACVEVCPTKVMRVNQEESTPYKCTDCKQCAEVCPRDALSFE
ncbi:MAG: 4Fe-4S ferredoxin [Bacillota bacterium]|jgi:ferredoxin|nr:4Fe-4S ferredoxin [Bacillota bacterium]